MSPYLDAVTWCHHIRDLNVSFHLLLNSVVSSLLERTNYKVYKRTYMYDIAKHGCPLRVTHAIPHGSSPRNALDSSTPFCKSYCVSFHSSPTFPQRTIVPSPTRLEYDTCVRAVFLVRRTRKKRSNVTYSQPRLRDHLQ